MGSREKFSNSGFIYDRAHHSLTCIYCEVASKLKTESLSYLHNHPIPTYPRTLLGSRPIVIMSYCHRAAALCHGCVERFTFIFHSDNYFGQVEVISPILHMRKLKFREIK